MIPLIRTKLIERGNIRDGDYYRAKPFLAQVSGNRAGAWRRVHISMTGQRVSQYTYGFIFRRFIG